MNILTLAFFAHTILATLIAGSVFYKKNSHSAKNFGIALLLNSAAFASWALCLLMPDNLTTFITLGAVLFLISLPFFVSASMDKNTASRKLFVILSIVFAVIIFIAGRFVFPTQQYISIDGLLLFNLAPMVQMLYLFGLLVATIPLVEKIGNMFKSNAIKYSLIVQIIGGVILITNNDYQTLVLTGLVIGVAQFTLWSLLLCSKKIWA